jgi:TRAP-type uncharacterized transport system substrate-binding protein
LASGPIAANQELAALLASASEAAQAPIRLELAAGVEGVEASLAALESGAADLAIVENSASYQRPTIRTVVPLYASVLHIAVHPERQAETLREVLDGAAVFAGPEDSAARLLLDLVASLYRSSDIEFSYVERLESNPDVVFVFAPISPRRAPVLDGYELFSLGDPGQVGTGSLADGLSLVAPLLRPFVIPEGTYGELTPTAIATVAIDTLLVTHRDTPRVLIYDLMQTLQLMGPRLVAQRADLQLDRFDSFETSRLTFPVHTGVLAFRARNEPGFFERASGIIEATAAGLAAIMTFLLAFFRYLRGLRKARVDEFYAQVLATRSRLSAGMSGEERRAGIEELRALRERAYVLLMSERLRADASFQILEALMADVMRELRAPNATESPTSRSK